MILLGVSRCGKTPTSLYLAMQFGIRAANYPFIADDMDNLVLPASLKPLQHKLFGLTIDPERTAAIREERRENSRYASLRQCRMEVAEVEALYRKNQILAEQYQLFGRRDCYQDPRYHGTESPHVLEC